MGNIPKGLAKVAGRARTRCTQLARENRRFSEPAGSGLLQKNPDKNPLRTFQRHGHKHK